MVYCFSKEYAILKQFAQHNNVPVNNLLITMFIFGFSYSIRSGVDLMQAIDNQILYQLQLNCCVNDSKGYALVLFFLHFFGEVLPLSVLFWLQAKIYSDRPKPLPEVKEQEPSFSPLQDSRGTEVHHRESVPDFANDESEDE